LFFLVPVVGGDARHSLYGFKRVIDRGFGGGASDHRGRRPGLPLLLMIVIVLARDRAPLLSSSPGSASEPSPTCGSRVQKNLLTLPPRFFEENRPSEIASRLTADTAILEQVVGSSVVDRACATSPPGPAG
jgi:ATP-binding cassette, subfamily B, bacterial